jgi:protein-tyrosine phosphatase
LAGRRGRGAGIAVGAAGAWARVARPDAVRAPTFGVYLLGDEPPEFGWEARWVRWPDFRLPVDPAYLKEVLLESLRRAGGERVEIACFGGHGRTGTALACLAVLDGVPAGEAVAYVRERYHPRAVETPWQKRFVRRFH